MMDWMMGLHWLGIVVALVLLVALIALVVLAITRTRGGSRPR